MISWPLVGVPRMLSAFAKERHESRPDAMRYGNLGNVQ